jgi:hypothetical protein
MLSLNVGSNINQVAGWLTAVQRKQLPFATAGALTATAFDVRKHVVEKTFPRDFDLKNQRFAGAVLRVDKANKRKLSAAVFDRLGREYLETQARGGIKRPTGQWIAIPTHHIKRTATGKVGKAKRPRNIVNKPNVFFRHQGPTPDIVRKPRGKGKQLEVLYQLVPLARIPKRLRFYEDAAKVVQRRMVPNFKKSFEQALKTARR